jgi:SulP family sulfate permease
VGTLFVGAAFFALGYLKVGSIVYHIPRQVIVGCIGGIGIFLVRTCFEVSTGIPFGRDLAAVWPLWGLSVAYEIGLRILLRCESVTKRTGPLLAPIYFLAIVPAFYLLLFLKGATIHDARKAYFLFPNTEDVSPFLPVEIMAQTVRRGAFSWRAFAKALPTTAMLAIFALMHVPINIPALAATVHVDYDLNHELKLHGVSNLASGLVGGLPNYLGYCNSVMYARCGGGGRAAGAALIVVEALSVAYGMRVVPYVPRCLAGCLILHVGLDLVKEALYDSLGAFDSLEYGCIVAIGFVMTVFGFASGLLFALVASTLIFTIQQAVHGNPVRGTMRGTTLRSSKWRTAAARRALDNAMGAVLVVQVVGTLFFGNATELKERVAQELMNGRKVTVLVLDFTLVRSIDASAAETVGSENCAIAKRHGARVCYASGRADGFPTAAPMTERLLTEQVHVARDLDAAILWAENVLLALKGGPTSPLRPPKSPQLNAPAAQLAVLMPSLSSRDRDALASHFKGRRLAPGEILWRQNDPATSIVIVAAGALVSTLEDEAGTAEEVSAGQMCGESGALTKSRRPSTVKCTDDGPAQVYVLGAIALAALSPELKLELCLLSMRYMSHRLDHVANRIWETRCVSI